MVISFLATTTVVFKIVQFAARGVGRRQAADAVLRDWIAGHHDTAAERAAKGKTIRARILAAAMHAMQSHPHDPGFARAEATRTALQEMSGLAQYLRILEVAVQAAPMLGLLGTVIGMIDAFSNLSSATGGIDPALLAGGIWTALVTTALGLGIAIPVYVISMWLDGRIETEEAEIEAMLSAFFNRPVPQ